MNDPNPSPASKSHRASRSSGPNHILQWGVMWESAQATQSLGGAEPPAPPVEEVQSLFPELEILQLIGHGGMGVVYKARHRQLDRMVALKIIKSSQAAHPEFVERFTREAQSLAKLSHPGIVTVYDFGCANDLVYLTMELVDGLNLRQIYQSQKLDPHEAIAMIPKICEALQYAHDQGIVHRDIKPENLLLTEDGEIKLADFGLAKLTWESDLLNVTQTQQAIGTPHYMAPEQMESASDVDHRADIFSLGVVFYEMLVGELPRGRFALPSQRASIDHRLDDVILRALEQDRNQRYQRVDQMKTDIESYSHTTALPPKWNMATLSPRISRAAIAAACFAPFGFIVLGMSMIVRDVQADAAAGPTAWELLARFTLLPLGLLSPFATTILGLIAISAIRNAPDRVYGMALAVAMALLYPLAVFDLMVFATLAILQPDLLSPAAALLGLVLLLIVNGMVYWVAYRAVSRVAGPS